MEGVGERIRNAARGVNAVDLEFIAWDQENRRACNLCVSNRKSKVGETIRRRVCMCSRKHIIHFASDTVLAHAGHLS